MKKIITYLAAAASLIAAASCSREEVQFPAAGNSDAIRLQVICSTPATRSAGIDSENTVNTLDFYFFKDTTAAAVYHYRTTEFDAENNSFTMDFVPETVYNEAAFPKKSELIRTTDNACTVFIIANYEAVLTDKTLAKMKETALNDTFLASEFVPYTPDAEDLYFVMTGQANVKGTTKEDLTDLKPETVELQRLAAKVTFDVNVAKSVTFTQTEGEGDSAVTYTETWTPLLSANNVRMYVDNAVRNAVLGGVDEQYPSSKTKFTYSDVVVSSDAPSKWTESGDYYQATGVGPFYTYPNNWTSEGFDTFVKIIVPWIEERYQNGALVYRAEHEIYYKVLLPEKYILSNYHYQLTVTLSVTGNEGDPEIIIDNANYKVVNWSNGGEKGVDTNIHDIKYLIVDNTKADKDGNFVFYTNSMNIQFSASGTVGYEIEEVYYYDYSSTTAAQRYIVQNSTFNYTTGDYTKIVGYQNGNSWATVTATQADDNGSWYHIDTTPVGDFSINRQLCNDMSASTTVNRTTRYFLDTSPYYYKVKLYLNSDPDTYKEVNFIQYPQTYVIPQESTNQRDIYGYIWINNTTWNGQTGTAPHSGGGNNGNNTYYNNIVGLANNGTNANPNMYIITTAVLSNDSYNLGDPRSSTIDNSSKSSVTFSSAPAVGEASNRRLANYHPTDASKNSTFIAPKVRIASSYGRRGGTLPWANAWDRCASYQEDGYPAGRWRIPTAAELLYFNTLSNHGFIPSLFASAEYWTGVNGVSVADAVLNTNNTGNASVRCVYDDWFWGSEPVSGAQNTFMWGDINY